MSPSYFWRCSPRKFNALCKVHVNLNSSSKSSGKGKGKAPIAKLPDTFIDKVL